MQNKLIAWRKFFNITQEEMAKLIGVDVRTYINKESGQSQFKANEMFAISRRLGKPIEELFVPTNFMIHEVTA